MKIVCPNCGEVRRSLLNAMDHMDHCKPATPPPPPPEESVRAYIARIA